MLLVVLIATSAVCAILPALLFCINLSRYRAPTRALPDERTSVSVLIPARNEESNIGEAMRCVLSSSDVDLEVLVWNDQSTDRTGDIVETFAAAGRACATSKGPGSPPRMEWQAARLLAAGAGFSEGSARLS